MSDELITYQERLAALDDIIANERFAVTRRDLKNIREMLVLSAEVLLEVNGYAISDTADHAIAKMYEVYS